jgi:hypothetical protein
LRAGGGTGAEVLGGPPFVCFGLFQVIGGKAFIGTLKVSMNDVLLASQLNNRNITPDACLVSFALRV